MDSQRSIGTYSKYATYVKCPDPQNNEDAFIRFLFDYCSKQSEKPVLFPTNDQWAIALSRYKKMLSEVSIPCVAEWDAIEVLIHKDKFYGIGQSRGYLTPKTWNFESIQVIPDKDFPVVAKPLFRRASSNTDIKNFLSNMDRLRLTVLNTKDHLNVFLEKEEDFIENLLFQEYVRGMSDCMYTVGIYADGNADILGSFTGHKVRGYPANNGDCIVGEKALVPDYVLENTKRIVKDLHYTGIAEFEYKKDEITGIYKLIEVNPRSWSWIGITPACGVNLPLIAFSNLTGKNFPSIGSGTGTNTVKYVKIFEDLLNCLFRYRNDYPEWSKSFVAWEKDIRADEVIFAEYNAEDWPILFIAALKTVLMLLRSIPDIMKKPGLRDRIM